MEILEILRVSGLTTIQDMGRPGYQKYGVPVGGFMDEVTARLVNYLVGNEDNTPLIEFYMYGPTILFKEDAVFAIGGEIDAYLNGSGIDPWRSYLVQEGDVLELQSVKNGVYGYLAVAGGFKCKRILGSCSTNLRTNFGRILKNGDILFVNAVSLKDRAGKVLPEQFVPRYNEKIVHVILGPQLENFTQRGIDTFLSSEYEVTAESDRMGYRLSGPVIQHSEKGSDIITDALPLGAIQVPGSGCPIVMMADRPTTGGYPKIGIVSRVDLPNIVQSTPGTRVKFEEISLEKAQELLIKREKMMQGIKLYLMGKARGFKVNIQNDEYVVFLKEV